MSITFARNHSSNPSPIFPMAFLLILVVAMRIRLALCPSHDLSSPKNHPPKCFCRNIASRATQLSPTGSMTLFSRLGHHRLRFGPRARRVTSSSGRVSSASVASELHESFARPWVVVLLFFLSYYPFIHHVSHASSSRFWKRSCFIRVESTTPIS